MDLRDKDPKPEIHVVVLDACDERNGFFSSTEEVVLKADFDAVKNRMKAAEETLARIREKINKHEEGIVKGSAADLNRAKWIIKTMRDEYDNIKHCFTDADKAFIANVETHIDDKGYIAINQLVYLEDIFAKTP